jgi:REP element-mobilizing transposase RayT
MSFWRLFYHLVWATKNREPVLTCEVEPIVYDFLRVKAIGLGAAVFALNGTADHVHLVVAIPPAIAVSDFIGQVKGVASAKYNKGRCMNPLYWQAEYGVFSFDGKRLPGIIAYVERQREHHAQNKTIPVLERTADERSATPLHI